MLIELRIRNFALIDDLTVRLGPGLNVLTGETGAGKSIVVGALSLLLGERASADVVRDGADRASVEGAFDIGGRADLVAWLDARGLEAGEGVIVLKREVALEGRNRAWVNGSPTTATLLGELGDLLVSLHGQHQHQTLLRRDEQRAILDAFAGNGSLLLDLGRAHGTVRDLRERIANLEDRRRQALQRADFLRFQVEEIEAADLAEGEDERLEDEARRLSHAEELITLAGTLVGAISGEDSVTDRLGSIRRALDQLTRVDPSQSELSELFDTAWYALEEIASRLEDYLGVVEHDPERLESIRRRQDTLYRLKTKYGATIPEVLDTLESARSELALIDDAEWEVTELKRQLGDASDELDALAQRLTERRRAAATKLAAEVGRILPELGMEGGTFEVALLPLERAAAGGAEEIEFRVALNRGFAPAPLAAVASGGELSRVMLALKTILARLDDVSTLVFDEVDAGIGGRVALRVADKMREVASSRQVLAITHLPQIASRADVHLLVRKEDGPGRTTTSVTRLDDGLRVQEVARMLGGDPESDASITHARELLEKGRALTATIP